MDAPLSHAERAAMLAEDGLANTRNIFRNLAAMVRDAGLGIPTDHFLEPASPEGQTAANHAGGQAPHPDLVKAQAEAHAAAQRLILDRQKAQAELALGQQHGAAKLQLERDKAIAKPRWSASGWRWSSA